MENQKAGKKEKTSGESTAVVMVDLRVVPTVMKTALMMVGTLEQ